MKFVATWGHDRKKAIGNTSFPRHWAVFPADTIASNDVEFLCLSWETRIYF